MDFGDALEDEFPRGPAGLNGSGPPLQETGPSEGRYEARKRLFEDDGLPHPHLRHWALWVLHNAVVHPLLGLRTSHATLQFHELTSQLLNHRHPGTHGTRANRIWHTTVTYRWPRVDPSPKARFLWAFHNIVAHTAIGLVPCGSTFALHDLTAELMDVQGWV